LPLDRDIREIVERVIENDMTAPKVPKKRLPKLKKVWKCDHAHDFLYGHRAGYYKGLAEGITLEWHKRELTQGEENEIFEILEPHTLGLRQYFAYYKEIKRTRGHKPAI
jgi:hypothetical protein